MDSREQAAAAAGWLEAPEHDARQGRLTVSVSASSADAYEAAVAAYTKAVKARPNFADAYFNRALAVLPESNLERLKALQAMGYELFYPPYLGKEKDQSAVYDWECPPTTLPALPQVPALPQAPSTADAQGLLDFLLAP